jgi:hypothetical protein
MDTMLVNLNDATETLDPAPDPAYTRLLDRIEELQFELARLRADAAKRQPYGDAVRRAKAFDVGDDSGRRRPTCRTRSTDDEAADTGESGNDSETTAAETRVRDDGGRDVCTLSDDTALRAMSVAGRGAVLSGGRAALRLLPAEVAGPPNGGRAGDLHVDVDAALWYFGVDGWTRLA